MKSRLASDRSGVPPPFYFDEKVAPYSAVGFGIATLLKKVCLERKFIAINAV